VEKMKEGRKVKNVIKNGKKEVEDERIRRT
jgi:hypothetical protein